MSNIIDDSGSAGLNSTYCQNLLLSEGPSKIIREELKKSALGKYKKILEMLGKGGKGGKGGCESDGMQGMDIRDKLMLLLEVVLSEIDDQIMGKITELQKKSKEMKGVSQKSAEKKPGYLNGLNTDSSIIQTQLTMLVQERQRFVEAINNAFKSFSDADENSVRRMV